MTPPLLTFRKVCFNYPDGPELLLDATFTLREGEMTALVGPNGVGKTTLLRLATGILLPATGDVLLDGVAVAALKPGRRAREVAFVAQRLEVPFRFTVQQIVEQGRTPYARPLRGLDRRDRMAVDRSLDLTSTTGLRNRIFNELSGGERQRVKIALGLAQEPRLLLLDEPTQSLDIGRQIEMIDLMRRLRQECITVFASMHDLHHVRGNFDRALLLGPDHRLIDGAPDEVMTASRLEWAFDCPPGRYDPQLNPTFTGARS